ncbi:uncharacterized protein MELLADRAFT_66392 [Melampsora larici-populina 98AG31]|uniref:Uncharacterized protein n=1 Tax=Melampsora larici-populina (strain 98AG31 / pathotype 3-4-7) TaxID=747676 RepID=F4RZ10_MELLP|nr:uncharacterized protein MELLADRAFT_66392 [Melampsora larici-populina 98AG31]EGG02337.1 hypothetical protein MELLADRAFT_66392 [Melampsora larici-populina 98AG31]
MDVTPSGELNEHHSEDPIHLTPASKETDDLITAGLIEGSVSVTAALTEAHEPALLQNQDFSARNMEAPEVDALLAIDLRIRLLETIIAGSVSSSDAFQARVGGSDRQKFGTRAETVVKKLNDVLHAKHNDVVRRFVESYDLNEPLLHIPNPIYQQAQSILEKDQRLTANEKLSLVFESETELTTLEKDLREIDMLNSRGFLDSGKLTDGGPMKDDLKRLTEEVKLQIERITTMESRTSFTAKPNAGLERNVPKTADGRLI